MVLLHQTLANGLVSDTDIQGRIYQASSLGVADIPPLPKKPFLVWRPMPSAAFREVFESGSGAAEHTFNLYCYDHRGESSRLTRILQATKPLIEGLVGTRSSTGALCIGARWVNMSQTSEDEQYDAVFRFAVVQLVGSS